MMRKYLITTALLATSLTAATVTALDISIPELAIPELGATSSSILSDHKEQQIGDQWLRQFRNQAKLIEDPLLDEYFSELLHQLNNASDKPVAKLQTVIINNSTLNAFAVPGGIVGINTGLFKAANNEAEFASVLAHELGHLSQHHFARSLEQQKNNAPLSMAGVLAGIVLAATTGSDAGMAAIMTSQAANLDNRLRYSRAYEREADRLAMQTLANAKMNPNAVATMFGEMLSKTRYMGNRVPEFLLTHPITESRVNDARNRARYFKKQFYTDNFRYQLLRVRAQYLSQNKQLNTQDFLSQKNRSTTQSNQSEAINYGLALAYKSKQQWQQSLKIIKRLSQQRPNETIYRIEEAELLSALGKHKKALQIINAALSLAPNSYSLHISLATIALKDKQPKLAEQSLSLLSKQHPQKPLVWYLLAEANGLTHNIEQLHLSRAEYFALNGQWSRSIKQLNYGLKNPTLSDISRDIYKTKIKAYERAKQRIKI